MASTGGHQAGRRPDRARRPSAAVYRRRRLVVLVVVLLVVAALAVGAAFLAGALARGADAGGAGRATTAAPAVPAEESQGAAPVPTSTAAPTPTDTAPAATPTPEPSGSASAAAPTPTGATGCAETVVVVAETDKSSYAAGEEPVLSLVVRNEGEEECDVNLGTSQMEFVVTRDDERIFSSVDCQAGSQDLQRTLGPDDEERATFDWARNRTVPDCTVIEDEPEPGEYTVVTRLGARSSAPVEFTLQ